MTYKEILTKLSNYSRVIVGGIQRSGTTYGAYIMAKDLGYSHIDENNYRIHDTNEFLKTLNKENVVIQCVAHTQLLDGLITDNTILVWMDRDNEAIAHSEDKINWHPREFTREQNKYKARWGDEVLQFKRNAEMKKHYWEIQKQDMGIPYIEVPYSILEQTSEYAGEYERKSFGAKQIK